MEDASGKTLEQADPELFNMTKKQMDAAVAIGSGGHATLRYAGYGNAGYGFRGLNRFAASELKADRHGEHQTGAAAGWGRDPRREETQAMTNQPPIKHQEVDDSDLEFKYAYQGLTLGISYLFY